MDALLMCGGRGTRLGADVEKPLFEIGGRPMIDRVHDALLASRVDAIHAVGAPHTPQTRDHFEESLAGRGESSAERDSLAERSESSAERRGSPAERAGSFLKAPGEGYVADLQYALERIDPPVVTVASDLPLLAGDAVDDVLDSVSGASLAVHVPAALKRRLGASLDGTRTVDGRELAPTGINVVAGGRLEETIVTYDARLAVNVNRRSDVPVAEELL